MDLDSINYQLVAAYLAKECSAAEREKVEQWICESDSNKEKFLEIKRTWELSPSAIEKHQDVDFDKEWNRLYGAISQPEQPNHTKNTSANTYQTYREISIHSGMQRFIRIAAVFLIAGLIGVWGYQQVEQPEPKSDEPVFRQLSTNNGERAQITLSDGTAVMLNADSEIRIPSKFTSGLREVYLDGQAFFDVHRDEDSPFIVHTNQSVVRVLGTTFSIRSYPEDQQVQVVVKEGRVSLGDKGESNEQNAILDKNELGIYDIGTKSVETQTVDNIEAYLNWREGYLTFKKATMKEVAVAIERRYDVEINFASPDIKELKLTANLKSRSLKNVLDVITSSLSIEYQLSDNKINLSY